MSGSRLHALLIGIDRYRRPDRSEPGLFEDLEGAVLDVQRWSTLLERRGVPADHVQRLVEPREGGPADTRPTYERIVQALCCVERRARPGEDVLFAFSGHGGCVPTLVPELKGDNGVDEALIPAGAFEPGAQVLHDVELAVVLERWVQRGLRVTLCFDCCHAGGATRATRARGTGRLDTTPRPARSLIADQETLRDVWRTVTRRRRDLSSASGWLPDPRGYVFFAACGAHERAYEGRFDALGPGGALTRALLGALEEAPEEVTCAQLHREVLDRVRRLAEGQNPQLEGERDRTFWRTEGAVHGPPGRRPNPVDEVMERGDPGHYLQDLLSLSLHRAPDGFDPQVRDPGALRRFVAAEAPLTGPVREGQWICLHLENRSAQPLFVALYARQPEGGRKKLFPAAGVGEADLLAAGGREVLPLRPRLEPGSSGTVEVVEALAANEVRLFQAGASDGLFWAVKRLELAVVA